MKKQKPLQESNFHLLVDKKDYVKYYGPLFSKRPEMFKIIGGFKKQIFALSQQLQRETQASNKNVNKKKICHKRKRDDLSDNEENSNSITRTKTIDLHLEMKKIKKLILNWIEQKISKASDTNENDYLIEKVKNLAKYIKIKVEVGDENFIFATISCFLCNTSIKIIKCGKNENNTNARWMVSNFYKHFLKHLSNTQNDISTASRTSFKKSSLLTSYFSKTDVNKNLRKDLDTAQNKELEQGSSSEIIPVEDTEETEEKTISETVVEENNSNPDSDTGSSNF